MKQDTKMIVGSHQPIMYISAESLLINVGGTLCRAVISDQQDLLPLGRVLFRLMVVSILAVWFVTLGLLYIAGYGIGRWLTPPALQSYELLLTPLWGYGLLVFVAYYGLTSTFTLRIALLVALVLALGLGALRFFSRESRYPRVPLVEAGLVTLIGVVAAGLGVVPLLRAGYLLPIGHGWDIEFYLPLATYLQDYSYPRLNNAAKAPLLNVILAEPTSVRAIGFSYLHGMIDLLGGWSATGTFPLLMALVRGLSVVPVYLLLRVGLGARVYNAALGALLVAANELLLWISYNNFAMHVSSMPLVPLATLLTLVALQPNNTEPQATIVFHSLRERASALAGAVAATTMLTLSYHPALLAYGALAASIGLWALWLSPAKRATFMHGLLIIFGCLSFGWLAHWRAPRAFFDVYRVQTPSIGGDRFASLTELLGVATFHHQALAIDQPAFLDVLSWLAVVAIGLGIGVALWQGTVRKGPALALVAFVVLYSLGLRYVIAFPYGFYKGVSYLNFVPLSIAGTGLGSLIMRKNASSGRRRAHHIVGTALLLLLIGMTGWTTYRLLQTYRVPVLASADQAAFFSALWNVPQQTTVELVDHPEMRGPAMGMASLALYNHAWVGRGQTGFALFHRPAPGTTADYALMHPTEDPRAWGFAPNGAIAYSRSMVLYRKPVTSAAFLSGTNAAYTPPTGSLQRGLDSLQVQNLTHGDYRTVTPEAPVTVYASADRLSWQQIAEEHESGNRVLQLQLASTTEQTITINIGNDTKRFTLPIGVSQLTLPAASTPTTWTINVTNSPVVIRSAQLFTADPESSDGIVLLSDTLAVQTTTQANNATVETEIYVASTERKVLHAELELYEISERTPRHYARGTFGIRANEPATLTIDLLSPTAALNGGALPIQALDIQDGTYFAALWLYDGTTLQRRIPFVRFERQDGQITSSTPLDANATFAQLSALSQGVNAQLGPAQLERYAFTPSLNRLGDTLQLKLEWLVTDQPDELLLVFAQLLGPDDHKWAAWDGAAGGDWWPSPAWQPGDRIRQDIPLVLDPQTPPGRYRLAVGLYRASTGERLPVSGAQAQQGLVVLQEVEVGP